MANILTPDEGANFVRTEDDDAIMLQLLPLVDKFIEQASGHDWTADATIHPTAKLAAGMLLVTWYDNPAMVGSDFAAMGIAGQIAALQAEAMKYRKYEFGGRDGAGGIFLAGARKGDEVIKLEGTYGVSGDQSASFESVLTVVDQIQQASDDDLSDNLYVVVLKHPAEDVSR